MLGLNGGLIGKPRSTYSNTGIWTTNEQRLSKNDPYWNDTSLLLHMDGANGSTSYADNSKNVQTVTANGDAQISTSQSKFGGGSSIFDGTNDYLTVASATANAFGYGNFTIELWARRTGQSAVGASSLLDFRTAEPSTQIFLEAGTAANSNLVQLYINGSYRITGGALAADTWVHLALCRSAGSTRLFIDGTQSGSTYTDINNYSATSLVIGGRFAATSSDYRSFNGYIDDLRITKGIARYTANFTPPSAPFPDA